MIKTNRPTDLEQEGIKLHYETLVAEYNQLREHVGMHRTVQSQLDHVSLAGLGLAVPLIVFVLQQNVMDISAMLLLPVLFFSIAFSQIRHERQIFILSIYIDKVLRCQMNEILSRLEGKEVTVIEYERYLTRTFPANNRFTHWIGIATQSLISLGAGCGMILFYLFLHPPFTSQWSTLAGVLLFVDVAALLICLALAYYLAGQVYDALQEHYLPAPKKTERKKQRAR